jgi:hypothetical protein
MVKRKQTKVELLLEVLWDEAWHLGDELAQRVGWRFADAVHKARKKGYMIETELLGVGQARKYRLLKF